MYFTIPEPKITPEPTNPEPRGVKYILTKALTLAGSPQCYALNEVKGRGWTIIPHGI